MHASKSFERDRSGGTISAASGFLRKALFSCCWIASEVGEASWSFLADVNGDKRVNIIDIALFAQNFGKTYATG